MPAPPKEGESRQITVSPKAILFGDLVAIGDPFVH